MVSVVEFKPVKIALPLIKKKLDIDINKYSLWPVLPDGRRVDLSQGPYSKERTWTEQGVSQGAFIYVRLKSDDEPASPVGPSPQASPAGSPDAKADAPSSPQEASPSPDTSASPPPPPPPPKAKAALPPSASTPPPPPPRPTAAAVTSTASLPPPPPPRPMSVSSIVSPSGSAPPPPPPRPDSSPPPKPVTPPPSPPPSTFAVPSFPSPTPPPFSVSRILNSGTSPSPAAAPLDDSEFHPLPKPSEVAAPPSFSSRPMPPPPTAMNVPQGGLAIGSSYNPPPAATTSYLAPSMPATGTAAVGDLNTLKNELSQIFVSEIRNLRAELQREREQSQAQAQSFERRLDALEHAVRDIQSGRTGGSVLPPAASSSMLGGSTPTFAPAGSVPTGSGLNTTPVRLERPNPILEEKRAALATTVSLYEFARSEVESLRMRQSLEKEKQALQQQMSFERRELSSLVQRTSDRTLAKVETLSREIETLKGRR